VRCADERAEELVIVCSNLKLTPQQTDGFVDRLKRFFGGKKGGAANNPPNATISMPTAPAVSAVGASKTLR
jgi:hypothetical protein